MVKRGADIDPPQIGADAGLLCRLRGRAAEGTLEWVRDADVSRLGIRYPRHSDDALRASLTVLAGQPVVVDVRSALSVGSVKGRVEPLPALSPPPHLRLGIVPESV